MKGSLQVAALPRNDCPRSNTAKVTASVLALMVVSIVVAPGVRADVDPMAGGSGGNSLAWDHLSRIGVTEQITGLGAGEYRYSYTITNNESSGIWGFAVYTRYPMWSHTPFSVSTWSADAHPLGEVVACYDARNVDSSLAYVSHTWAEGWPNSSYTINPGQTVSGFSFVASTYDTGLKLYNYELFGNYAGASGKVDAVGYVAIPEPSGIMSLLFGLAGGLVWRRRR